MKRFSELQGVEICGETAFEVLSDRLPQKLVWPGYGFYIEVPAGALPPGVTASVAVRASLRGQFSIPENKKLISAIYWISCSDVFLTDVAVNIQHYACISNEDEATKFKFIIARVFPRATIQVCRKRWIVSMLTHNMRPLCAKGSQVLELLLQTLLKAVTLQ